MAASWQDVATRQAELIASRLRELLSSGLGLLRSELGVDLGLEPQLYPSWVILLTALLGALLIVALWAAACGGIFGGKKRTISAAEERNESTKASLNKAAKTEEQKKKIKKKPTEKKPQPNGRTVVELQEDVKVAEENLKPSPEVKAEKTKKNKKKPKTEAKQVPKAVSPSDGKEPDEGAWETKISNREKRQQRRKDKQTGDDSGSPGGVDAPASSPVEQPKATATVPAAQRKSKAEPLRVKAGKGEAIISQVSASWTEVPAVNGGGWNDMAMKLPVQMTVSDGENWTTIPKAAGHRNPEPPAWGQEMEGSWSGVDGRIKADLSPVSFKALGLNTTAAEPQPIKDLQCHSQPQVDDEWSGLNGTAADPSSDWNAPSELWGNYEEPQPESPTPPEEPAPEAIKGSDDEKEKGESTAGGGGKSKKKKKKKKKQGEDVGAAPQSAEMEKEAAAEVEELSPPVQENVQSMQAAAPAAEVRAERPAAAPESTSQKPPTQVPQRPAEPESAAKQSGSPPASQKKSEENWQSPKQVKKKKARRET
ncbi:protein LYRIC-like isoform X3 [Megalops cyprinoides]|uniref:protein LYRIC-like isoform X3 n=1 Tax=Megalops cyprinoides TaxID=118141 RepID=UPI001863D331|nr:protein LYRIC-like isoform X3 [Megalops cyprinoides]